MTLKGQKKYTLEIKSRGRGLRSEEIYATSVSRLKIMCKILLEYGSSVWIVDKKTGKRTKIL